MNFKFNLVPVLFSYCHINPFRSVLQVSLPGESTVLVKEDEAGSDYFWEEYHFPDTILYHCLIWMNSEAPAVPFMVQLRQNAIVQIGMNCSSVVSVEKHDVSPSQQVRRCGNHMLKQSSCIRAVFIVTSQVAS